MIGVIAVLKVKEGAEAQFEAGFKALAAKVKAHEPGNIAYQLTKSRTEPQTYKVLELYADEAALKHHGQTDYFKAAGAEVFAPVLAGRPEIEVLDGVE
jgi:quinol monooxygenase YgiN